VAPEENIAKVISGAVYDSNYSGSAEFMNGAEKTKKKKACSIFRKTFMHGAVILGHKNA